MTVTSADVCRAENALKALNPIYDALTKLDPQFLNHDTKAMGVADDFVGFLRPVIDEANAVLLTAQEQYDSRDQVLINHALRFSMSIPEKIEGHKKSLISASKFYSKKYKSLEEKSFSKSEIDKILPPDELKTKLDALNEEIEQLTQDEAALKLFLNDRPSFDVEIIKNTYFYKTFIEHEATLRTVPSARVWFRDI